MGLNWQVEEFIVHPVFFMIFKLLSHMPMDTHKQDVFMMLCSTAQLSEAPILLKNIRGGSFLIYLFLHSEFIITYTIFFIDAEKVKHVCGG